MKRYASDYAIEFVLKFVLKDGFMFMTVTLHRTHCSAKIHKAASANFKIAPVNATNIVRIMLFGTLRFKDI